MSALVALVQMSAQSSRPAIANIVEGFALWAGEYSPPAGEKVVSMRAENIGHLQPIRFHG